MAKSRDTFPGVLFSFGGSTEGQHRCRTLQTTLASLSPPMVRFKVCPVLCPGPCPPIDRSPPRSQNRWLLAELIFPDDLVSILGATPSASQLVGSAVNLPSSQDQGDTVVDADALALPLEFYPARPAFMVPTPASTSARGLVLSGSGAAAAGAQTSKGKLGPVKEKDIWFAVKETVIAVFGDAGWALVGSSFNGTCWRAAYCPRVPPYAIRPGRARADAFPPRQSATTHPRRTSPSSASRASTSARCGAGLPLCAASAGAGRSSASSRAQVSRLLLLSSRAMG